MERLHLLINDRVQEPRPFCPDPGLRKIRPWLRWGSQRRRVTALSVLLGLTILFAALWLSAPYFARDYINRNLAGLPDYTGRVEWVRIHPWNVSLDIYNAHLDKKGGEIPVHFLYAPRCHVSLQWSQIFHGVARVSVTVIDPQINLVSGPSPEQSQVYISQIWLDTVKAMMPWQVNQVRIHHGDIHYLNFHVNPPIDLEMNQFELVADNMSNSKGLKIPLPAIVTLTARPLLTGTFAMNLAVNFDEQYATFTQNIRMEHVPAPGVNAALQNYLKVRVKSGEIGFYSELASNKGIYHGYVKPFFYRLEFEPKPSDVGNPGSLWSGILNVTKGLFENNQHAIATESEVSGQVDQPHVDAVGAISGVLVNACIEALRPGFDPSHTPSAPTDTVTTPLSPSIEQVVNPPSLAAKN